MFSKVHALYVTGLEINNQYINKSLNILQYKSINPIISLNKVTNSFALRFKINCTYSVAHNKQKILVYNGEKIGDLKVTSKDKDRPQLILFLTEMLKELDLFIEKEFPSFSKLKPIEININEIADDTFSHLEKHGIY